MITPHFDDLTSCIIKVGVMRAPDAQDLFGLIVGIKVYVDDEYRPDCSSPWDLAETWGTRLDASDSE